MRITRYQDLIAWQLARKLERRVFAFTDKPRVARDFDFCRQIRKSSSSAPRNMSEGFGRFWPAEFAHKMHIAIGELEETQDHIDKALEEKYIDDDEHLDMYGLADRAIGAAVKFVEYLDAAGPDWKKDFLARRREKYRQRRAKRAAAKGESSTGTTDPKENRGPQNQNQEPQNHRTIEPQNGEPQNQNGEP